MMKRLLPLLLALLCLLPAHADGPRPFDDEYLSLSAQELAGCMESAMAAADLAGAVVCRYADDSPAATIAEYSAFCVARRTDGLLTLCCFVPEEDSMALAWHNDLLLSHYQELSMSTAGAVWSCGVVPQMRQEDSDLHLQLPLWGDVHLQLRCDGYYSQWSVMELGAYVVAGDGSRLPLLTFKGRDLDEYPDLSRCHPGNWLESGEGSW